MPPVALARVLALPSTTAGGSPTMRALAARPHGVAIGVDVYYDDTAAGDFPLVGKQRSYALPVSLYAGAGVGAGTIRVALLPAGTNGEDFQRDQHLLRDWAGGATEGRNDELLLVLIKRGSGGAIAANGDRDYVEVCSVSGSPTLVSAGVFDIPVLRGRLATLALDWSAGSFPDAWSTYEAWLIPSAQLAALEHADFDSMLSSGATGYFRLSAYAGRGSYGPEAAYGERQALEAAARPVGEYGLQPDTTTWVPALTAKIPAGYAEQIVIDGGSI